MQAPCSKPLAENETSLFSAGEKRGFRGMKLAKLELAKKSETGEMRRYFREETKFELDDLLDDYDD